MRWPGPRDPIPANMRQVLALPFACEPGTAFQYKPDPQIIVYLLEEIYHESITELFRSRLLSCFSSRACEWDREDVQGMRLSLPLLNELGRLMLNQGCWAENGSFLRNTMRRWSRNTLPGAFRSAFRTA